MHKLFWEKLESGYSKIDYLVGVYYLFQKKVDFHNSLMKSNDVKLNKSSKKTWGKYKLLNVV